MTNPSPYDYEAWQSIHPGCPECRNSNNLEVEWLPWQDGPRPDDIGRRARCTKCEWVGVVADLEWGPQND